MYADLEDIRVWLRDSMIAVNDANTKQPNIDAGRIIRARLSGVFAPTVLQSWDSPDNTPELIRSIAGRLTAAYLYRSLMSSETDQTSLYANELWIESMGVLNDIRSGDTILVDANNVPIDSTGANLLSFFPTNAQAPLFSVNDVFS